MELAESLQIPAITDTAHTPATVRELHIGGSVQQALAASQELLENARMQQNAAYLCECMLLHAHSLRMCQSYQEAINLNSEVVTLAHQTHNTDAAVLASVNNLYIQSFLNFHPSVLNNILGFAEYISSVSPYTQIIYHLSAGHCYGILSNYSHALKHFHEALEIAQRTAYPDLLARCLSNLGLTYFHSGDYRRCIQYCEEALRSTDKALPLNRANTYMLMTDAYTELLELPMATECSDKCMEYVEVLQSPAQFAAIAARKSLIYFHQKKYDECFILLDSNKDLLYTTASATMQRDYLLHMAKLFSQQDWHRHNLDKAYTLIRECIDICSTMNQHADDVYNYSRAMDVLGTIEEKRGNYQEALRIVREVTDLHVKEINNVAHQRTDAMASMHELEIKRREVQLAKEKGLELEALNSRLTEQAALLEFQQKEIEQYNREILKANLELQRSYEQKREIVAIAAHQLKSPLVAIKYGADHANLLSTQEDVRDLVKGISTQSSNLIETVNRFITISSIGDKSSVAATEVDVRSVMNSIIDQYTPQSQKKNVTVHSHCTSPTLIVNTDEFALTQIIDNLLSNAVKYSPQNGRIEIQCGISSANPPEVPHYYFSIRNFGSVLSSDDQKHLFEKYRVLGNATGSDESSSGLGLSIVKQFVLALGGQIHVTSSSETGTEFKVTVPLHE
ncbi:MAG: tetratricopeptide repeat protein [Candidatus Kapabacteria bacterium]|nr:tetratricopeptide repeat protein [Candidatus Kapabacteria bacterium]